MKRPHVLRCKSKHCNSLDILQHCDSPTCTWVRCTTCKSFGDEQKWADMSKPPELV